MINFGSRLKKLRLQKSWSQAQLAERLGLTKSVVSAYENGIRMPSYEVLLALARVYKVSTDYLLGNEKSNTVELSGLTEKEMAAVKNLIKAMQDS